MTGRRLLLIFTTVAMLHQKVAVLAGALIIFQGCEKRKGDRSVLGWLSALRFLLTCVLVAMSRI